MAALRGQDAFGHAVLHQHPPAAFLADDVRTADSAGLGEPGQSGVVDGIGIHAVLLVFALCIIVELSADYSCLQVALRHGAPAI